MKNIIVEGQYNVAHICTRLQCDLGRGDKIAMRFVASDGDRADYTFDDIEERSNRFANALREFGFSEGDTLFTFLPKIPEQFFALLGALKMRLVVSPLFANFGEEALKDRLGDASAKILVTKKSFLKKIENIRSVLPCLKTIIVTDLEEDISDDILSYGLFTESSSHLFDAPKTDMDTASILHYTSGSTGKPKGVLHSHKGILTINRTSSDVLGLKAEDRYWCTADQGWVTGTSYGMLGPWSLGATQIHYGGGYDGESWLDILEKEEVSVLYTAPTALRMLMREDPDIFSRHDLKNLKRIYSVGEPLNPEVIRWSREVLGKDIYDTWFQTETGAIMIANKPHVDIRPGSMGKSVEGIDAAILDAKLAVCGSGMRGDLCLRSPWPSMFVAYLNNDKAYSSKFKDGYYLSGDVAFMDGDGYYWFAGRRDDVINTAGHLVGPFEVESALLEIEEVAESAVIAAPDDILFEKVVAFIRLKPGYVYDEELGLKIKVYVSNKVSTIAAPQDIVIVDSIPKTKSGKIIRRILKARYLGKSEGDASTLEES